MVEMSRRRETTMEPTLHHWANHLAATALSKWLLDREWVIVVLQSTHIVMLSVVFGCAVVINLRVLGISARGRSVSTLVRSLTRWMYGALLVLLITGSLQTIAEPMREFVAPAFWAKMTMVLIVFLLTAAFDRAVRRNHERWNDPSSRPRGAALFAIVSLVLWTAIIFCGRFIAYTWNFYV
ncbi:MAG TPA: DUF6644 family protein [Steroidobacteraceae bacterium]|jgi:hypothetical protein|nr:DUF6644 family protein [Steroidobacteraceae bacterium]